MDKKSMVRSFMLIPTLVMLSICVALSSRLATAADDCTNPVFAQVLAPLRARTDVPLRLPLVVGDAYDAALYAKVSQVSRTSYVIRIGQNCERSYCPYGTVSGTKNFRRTGHPRGSVVELAGGVTGYVSDGSKILKNSIITWDEGQYRYAIAIYAAEPAAMIKVANSALSCGNR